MCGESLVHEGEVSKVPGASFPESRGLTECPAESQHVNIQAISDLSPAPQGLSTHLAFPVFLSLCKRLKLWTSRSLEVRYKKFGAGSSIRNGVSGSEAPLVRFSLC